MTEQKKILIVEDQDDDQFIAKRNIMRQWPNATIITALDGQEAIEKLESERHSLPDLILLDINMPRMNGHEFLKSWSEQHKLPIPIVVMLTSSDQKADREQTEVYPFVKDYILKPLDKKTVESLSPYLDSTQ